MTLLHFQMNQWMFSIKTARSFSASVHSDPLPNNDVVISIGRYFTMLCYNLLVFFFIHLRYLCVFIYVDSLRSLVNAFVSSHFVRCICRIVLANELGKISRNSCWFVYIKYAHTLRRARNFAYFNLNGFLFGVSYDLCLYLY